MVLIHRQPKLTVCVNGRIARFIHIRLCMGTPGRVICKTLYGNPLDFSKIYNIVMNDEIKLTYLLFSVYLSVLCSFRPLGAIFLSDLSTVRFPQVTVDKLLKMAPNYTEQTSTR